MGKEDEKTNPDPITPVDDEKMLVVGIGASAGGVHALKTFFANVQKESGNAYVVILHLSPDFESQLAEVLQSAAAIPVKQVKDRKTKVSPNCVYVIPPNRGLEMTDGHLATKRVAGPEERRAPVDLFFRTLAESQGHNAVSVILTGTGPNGSMGIKRVKEMGGIVVVQDPNEAEYADMPLNSIATGLVDYVLPVAEIPRKINEYKSHLGSAIIPTHADEVPDESDEKGLTGIFTLLRSRTGHDFSNYKRSTVLRRIERRMNVHGKKSLPEYASFLRENPPEPAALLKDLLISVTNFFRDPAAFETLEREIIPKIFDQKESNDVIRIWVPGCATGEEAYSIAILCSEYTDSRPEAPIVQIFATDIDAIAIAQCRAALYSESDVADVSKERLQHFFQKEGDNYRVRRDIRETVLFAVHNAIKDPPFSKLDLISCRNLLIYLNRDAQSRIMETFHFALNPGGYLFLGTSESTDGDSDLFVPVNKEYRIFQSRPVAARLLMPVPELSVATLGQKISLKNEDRRSKEVEVLERLSYTALHRRLLEQYAPPSLVVNAEHDIVHLSERAGRYLQISGGEPSTNLLHVVRPELRLELRTALYQAVQRQTTVNALALRVKTEDGYETINLIVRPITEANDPNRGLILIIFEPAAKIAVERPEPLDAEEPVARRLEEELIHTKSQLRATIEQYEVQHEELKASNEELQAINEELRSAAEELETSKEELQSVNEELSTVNQELKIKIEELSQSNNDLQNLINSTAVGTIFLDRRLRVKLFTETATSIFSLIPADIGRPISDLKSKLTNVDLKTLAEKVLADLQPIEQEIEAEKNVWYMMRILPYRTSEDKIDGVVLTFVDISSRLRTETDLRRSQERLAKAMNIETVGVIFFDNDTRFVDCNDTFLKMTGYDRLDITAGRLSWNDLTPVEWRDASMGAIAELRSTGYSTPYEKEYIRRDGSRFFGLFATARVGGNEIVECVIDISSRKQSELDLAFKSRLLDAVEQSVIATDINGNVTYWNTAAERLYGWKSEEAIGNNILRLNTPKTSVKIANEIIEKLRNGKSWIGDFEVLRRDGSSFLAHVFNSPLVDDSGNVVGIVGVSADVGDRRRTEATLRETQDRMRIVIESATDYAIFTVSSENIVTSWSPGAEHIFGFVDNEIIGRSGELLFTEEDRVRGVPRMEIESALRTGRAEDERWHLRKDGSLFYASGVMQPLRPDGTRGLVKICRDQTEKIEAQGAVRERKMLERIVRTQEDERRRIARDLHDTLGQQLTGLRLKLEAIKATYGAEPAMMKAIDETQAMAKQIDDDVSFLNWELRPTALDNLGLRNALANYVNEWSKNFGIPAEFLTSRLRLPRLEPETEINIYRIAQEALNNVVKHAKAKKVSVLLEFNKVDAVLVVEDDGRGFNASRSTRRTRSGRGLGLTGMRERAALLGGALEIESARGKGTTVIARVPVMRDGSDNKAPNRTIRRERKRGEPG